MIEIFKLLLYVLLYISSVLILRREGWRVRNARLLWILTSLVFVVNVLFNGIVVVPLYFVQEETESLSVFIGLLVVSTVNYTVLANLLFRVAMKPEVTRSCGGLNFVTRDRSWASIIAWGITGGIIAALIIFGLQYFCTRRTSSTMYPGKHGKCWVPPLITGWVSSEEFEISWGIHIGFPFILKMHL